MLCAPLAKTCRDGKWCLSRPDCTKCPFTDVDVIRPKFALLVSSGVLSFPFKISGPVIVVLICPVSMQLRCCRGLLQGCKLTACISPSREGTGPKGSVSRLQAGCLIDRCRVGRGEVIQERFGRFWITWFGRDDSHDVRQNRGLGRQRSDDIHTGVFNVA